MNAPTIADNAAQAGRAVARFALAGVRATVCRLHCWTFVVTPRRPAPKPPDLPPVLRPDQAVALGIVQRARAQETPRLLTPNH